MVYGEYSNLKALCNSNSAHVQVPIQITLFGGITPAAIATPDIGVLLRQSLACYLRVPLASVVIKSVASNATGVVSSSIQFEQDAPVNIQSAPAACVGTTMATGRRQQLRRMESSPSASSIATIISLTVSS
jgi:hypothetical protein